LPLRLPADRLKFWVSFLPEERRQLRRDGIHLFGIRYWASALAPDVGRADDRLAVRYDPRDLSRVFVRRPNGHFVEARYRSLGQLRLPFGNAMRRFGLYRRKGGVSIMRRSSSTRSSRNAQSRMNPSTNRRGQDGARGAGRLQPRTSLLKPSCTTST
jgi:putative transposase